MLVFFTVMAQSKVDKSGHVCAPHLRAKEKLGKHKHCDSKIDAATQQNVKETFCWRLVKDSIGGRVLLSESPATSQHNLPQKQR
jgi:hypothetical protein